MTRTMDTLSILHVAVTQDIIDEAKAKLKDTTDGMPLRSQNCPIALAIKQAWIAKGGNPSAIVSTSGISTMVGDRAYTLPHDAAVFVVDFDRALDYELGTYSLMRGVPEYPEPFAFDATVRDEAEDFA